MKLSSILCYVFMLIPIPVMADSTLPSISKCESAEDYKYYQQSLLPDGNIKGKLLSIHKSNGYKKHSINNFLDIFKTKNVERVYLKLEVNGEITYLEVATNDKKYIIGKYYEFDFILSHLSDVTIGNTIVKDLYQTDSNHIIHKQTEKDVVYGFNGVKYADSIEDVVNKLSEYSPIINNKNDILQDCRKLTINNYKLGDISVDVTFLFDYRYKLMRIEMAYFLVNYDNEKKTQIKDLLCGVLYEKYNQFIIRQYDELKDNQYCGWHLYNNIKASVRSQKQSNGVKIEASLMDLVRSVREYNTAVSIDKRYAHDKALEIVDKKIK